MESINTGKKKILIIGDNPLSKKPKFKKLSGDYKFGGIKRSISNLITSEYFNTKFEYKLIDDNNNSSHLLGSIYQSIMTLNRLVLMLKREKFDMVLLYCNSINFAFIQKFFICLFIKISSIKLFVRYGGSKSASFFSLPYLQFLFRYFFSMQRGILVQGSTGLKFYSNFISSNIFTSSNFVKDIFLRKKPLSKKINNINVLISTGTDYKRKGFLLILESLKNFDNDLFNFSIIGCNRKVISEIKKCRMKNSVKLFPDLNQKQLGKVIENSQVLLHPSYKEGLPNLILESMAKGLFIITTDVGSIPDLVKDGKNGYVIKSGSSALISKSLNKLSKNKDIIYKSSKDNINLIENNYSENIVVPQTVSFLINA